MTKTEPQPRPLRVGMTLTVGGRTWEITSVDLGHSIRIISGNEVRYLYADLAALLPWEEPVGEWVTVNDLSALMAWAVNSSGSINWQEGVNKLNYELTRKFGPPPQTVKEKE